MEKYIRKFKREFLIILGRLVSDNFSIFIYKKIFDSKKFINTKLAKFLLIIIARKGIKKEIIREINIDGNNLKINILDYANLTKIMHFAVDPLPPILRTGGDIFIDIGCHVGYYTFLSAPYFRRIFSVDASSKRAEICRKQVFDLGLINKINVLNTALGSYDCPDKITLFENPFNSGGSFTSNVSNVKNNWDREIVTCSNLDDLLFDKIIDLKKINKVVLKIDVEGYELKVLAGSRKIINKFLPIILVEARPTIEIYKKIYELLPENYKIFDASEFLFGKTNKLIDTDLVCLPLKDN